MVLYFFLTALSIAATIFCIVMETEWWVWVIFAGAALLCLAIAIAKLREELEYVRAARKPKATKKAKKTHYPELIEHCLALSEEKRASFALQNYNKMFLRFLRDNDLDDASDALQTLLLLIATADGEPSDAEWKLVTELDPDLSHDLVCGIEAVSAQVSQVLREHIASSEFSRNDRKAFLSLCAAILTADGSITQKKLAFFESFS
jgi:uncharacterized tellurite resistance protein B-like protein